MATQEKYIYTNKSTPDELQKLLNDTSIAGAPLYFAGGFDTIESGGKPEIIGKCNGVSRPDAQHTTCFDTVKEKFGATGFYCLNPRNYYAGELWVDTLPDWETYTGLYDTDDVSAWIEPSEDV